MAKRFTDTGIWQKEWFIKFSDKQKLLLRFIFDNCNSAGIYEPNYSLLQVYLNKKITEQDFLSLNSAKKIITKLRSGKFFINGFIKFQYGQLNENFNPHKTILKILEENNIDFGTLTEREKAVLGTLPLVGYQEKEQLQEQESSCSVVNAVIETTTAHYANDNNIGAGESFEVFWEKYTKKSRKRDCLSWWHSNPDKREAAIAGLEWYLKSERVRNGFILDPIRYLRREIWNDNPEAYGSQNGLDSAFNNLMSDITAEQEKTQEEAEYDAGNSSP